MFEWLTTAEDIQRRDPATSENPFLNLPVQKRERNGSFSSTTSSVTSSSSTATATNIGEDKKFRSRTIGLKQASEPRQPFH